MRDCAPATGRSRAHLRRIAILARVGFAPLQDVSRVGRRATDAGTDGSTGRVTSGRSRRLRIRVDIEWQHALATELDPDVVAAAGGDDGEALGAAGGRGGKVGLDRTELVERVPCLGRAADRCSRSSIAPSVRVAEGRTTGPPAVMTVGFSPTCMTRPSPSAPTIAAINDSTTCTGAPA